MRNKELRIGNYIYSLETQNHQRITGLLKEQPFFDAITFDYPNYDEIEPIPLTEEWLLKFGLKKDYYIFYCRIVDNGCTVYFKGNFITKVESVHQLQNLYFALTGEELKIIS